MAQAILYGWAKNKEAATNRTVAALRHHHGVNAVGQIRNAIVLQMPCEFGNSLSNTLWTIVDNGGEVNVELVNRDQIQGAPVAVGVPYSAQFPIGLTAETMAWRIWATIHGKPIDWGYNDLPGVYGKDPLEICVDRL